MKKVAFLIFIFIISCSAFNHVSKNTFVEQNNITDKTTVSSFPVLSNPGSGSDNAVSIAIDSYYMYIAGSESSSGNKGWRIEKRYKDNGKFAASFGTGGFVNINPSTGIDSPNEIVLDGDYIYIAGYDEATADDGDKQWRVEKRDKSSGELINDFGTNGIINVNPNISSSYYDIVLSIKIDSSYIYLLGSSPVRIEKRDKISGSLISSFGSSGVVVSSNFYVRSMIMDNDYLYIAGDNRDTEYEDSYWHIEKRYKSNGALVNSFGVNGVVLHNLSDEFDDMATLINADLDFIYVMGDSTSQWVIEKRSKSDGSLVNSFGTNGIIQINPSAGMDLIYSSKIDSNYIYIAGCQNNTDDSSWRLEKRDTLTGNLIESFCNNGVLNINPSYARDSLFSITIDSDYVYMAGYDDCNFNYQWRIERCLK